METLDFLLETSQGITFFIVLSVSPCVEKFKLLGIFLEGMSPWNDVPSGLMSPRTSSTLERCPPWTNVSSESWQVGILSAGLMSPWNSVPWTNVATPRYSDLFY